MESRFQSDLLGFASYLEMLQQDYLFEKHDKENDSRDAPYLRQMEHVQLSGVMWYTKPRLIVKLFVTLETQR